MYVSWVYSCDNGHQWEYRLKPDEEPGPHSSHCPRDLSEAVTVSRMPPADRVTVRLIPAARVADAVTGAVELDDEFYVATRKYVFEFDATAWGWIHLILGVVVAVSGAYLLTGAVLARVVGVIMAAFSAIAGFAWIPWYPVWGITVVALAVSVIWALTAHGRDLAEA